MPCSAPQLLKPLAWMPPALSKSAVAPRACGPVLMEVGKEEDDRIDASAMRDEYIRAGGFIDGRPPDDLDRMATFKFSEMDLAGKVLFFVTGVLMLTLIVCLVVL